MATRKPTTVIYKRDKSGVEISGDPKDTKWQIWFDLVAHSKVVIILLIGLLLLLLPKEHLLPLLSQWISKLIALMTLFVGVVGCWLLLLSG